MPGPLGLQLAEIHGVPRGLYDGPVHEVMVPAKPGGGTQARASCPGKISVPAVRNLHQSGFSLSGELGLGVLPVGEGGKAEALPTCACRWKVANQGRVSYCPGVGGRPGV